MSRLHKDVVKREPTDPCDVERIVALSEDHTWHIARVRPAEEFAVIDRLARFGVFSWTPTREEWVQRKAGRTTERHKQTYAQIPGYVIVAAGRRPRWADVWNCEGVHEVMGYESRAGVVVPIRLGPLHVKALVEMCRGARQVQRFMRAAAKFDVGDRVLVTAGPFEGRDFEVIGFEDEMRETEARAIILAEIFGSPREMAIAVGALAKR